MLEPIHEPRLKGVLAKDFGDIIHDRISLGGRGIVDPGCGTKAERATGCTDRPPRCRGCRSQGDPERSQCFLYSGQSGHTVGIANRLRISRVKLAAKATTEFVDQCWAEGVGVPETKNLICEIQRILSTPTDIDMREGRSSPGHSVVVVLARLKEPFNEIFTLVTRLVINFDRNIMEILATAHAT